jgi:hypothetical protein
LSWFWLWGFVLAIYFTLQQIEGTISGEANYPWYRAVADMVEIVLMAAAFYALQLVTGQPAQIPLLEIALVPEVTLPLVFFWPPLVRMFTPPMGWKKFGSAKGFYWSLTGMSVGATILAIWPERWWALSGVALLLGCYLVLFQLGNEIFRKTSSFRRPGSEPPVTAPAPEAAAPEPPDPAARADRAAKLAGEAAAAAEQAATTAIAAAEKATKASQDAAASAEDLRNAEDAARRAAAPAPRKPKISDCHAFSLRPEQYGPDDVRRAGHLLLRAGDAEDVGEARGQLLATVPIRISALALNVWQSIARNRDALVDPRDHARSLGLHT